MNGRRAFAATQKGLAACRLSCDISTRYGNAVQRWDRRFGNSFPLRGNDAASLVPSGNGLAAFLRAPVGAEERW